MQMKMRKSLAGWCLCGVLVYGGTVPFFIRTAVAEDAKAKPAAKNSKKTADNKPKIIEKVPVPEDAVIEKVRAVVRDTFREGFSKTEPEDRLALASEIMSVVDKHDDVAAKYVMLSEAMDLAAKAGSAEDAADALEKMNQLFVIDLPARRQALLENVSKNAKGDEQEADLAEAYIDLCIEASRQDQFTTASNALDNAQKYALRSHDTVAKNLGKRIREKLKAQSRDYALLDQYRSKLDTTPDDPEANWKIGSYIAFWNENWKDAVPYFMKSSDKLVKSLAWMEKNPQAGRFLLMAADGWWELADRKEQEDVREKILAHAETLYTQAMPSLTGLLKTKAEKRLERLQEIRDESTAELLSGKQKINLSELKMTGKATMVENILDLPLKSTASTKILPMRSGQKIQIRQEPCAGSSISLWGIEKNRKRQIALKIYFNFDDKKIEFSSPNVSDTLVKYDLPQTFERNSRSVLSIELKKSEIRILMSNNANKTTFKYKNQVPSEDVQGIEFSGPARIISVIVDR